MKILFDGDVYLRSPFGGVVRYYNQLIEGLISRGVGVGLLISDNSGSSVKSRLPNCQVVQSVAEYGACDIFHGSYFSNYSVIGNSRVVVTVHDMIDELFPREVVGTSSSLHCASLKKSAIRHADHIVAVSRITKQDLQRLFDVGNVPISVIYHGVDPVFFSNDSAELCIKEFPFIGPFILHVGGREGYKNFEFLLESYAASNLKGEIKLVAVGSQSFLLPEEKKIVEKYDLVSSVCLMGYVSDVLLKCLYSFASLVVMPSIYEGFGYPIIEAMACGATVACSSAPALVELGQGVPLIFNPRNVDDAAKILRVGIAFDHLQRNKLGIQVASRLSVDVMIDGYCEVYNSLM